MKTDPAELTNCFHKAEYRETVREPAQALQVHGRKFNEPLMADAAVRADLEWAAGAGDAPYVPVQRATPKSD